LRDVSSAAGVSLGYLSEVERGRKEASSELLAAICGALEVSLADVLREVSDLLAREERKVRLAPVGFGLGVPSAQVPNASRPVAGIAPRYPVRTDRPAALPTPSGPPTSVPPVPVARMSSTHLPVVAAVPFVAA
jgi:transcriptional regulator with XRE-family HTH domain